MLKSLAQSTIDYLILAGVIMVVIIPLLMFSGNRLDAVRESQIVDAVKIIQNAVVELINLGYGSATERVIQIPTGIISQQILNNILILNFKGQDLKFEFGFNIAGVFPINPGRHYVKLFNNGTHIIFSICGNNIIEPPEQCDGTALPPGAPLGTTCYPPDSPNACKIFCIDASNCPFGYDCINDICTQLGFCGNNIIENFEQCDPPSSTPTSQCDPFTSIPGMGICTTVNGIPCQCQNTCGNNVIDPTWEFCDQSATPTGCSSSQTCINCQQCITTAPCGSTFPACDGICPSGQTCLTIGSSCSCITSTTCGNGVPDPGEQCGDPGTLGCASLGGVCNTSTCLCVPCSAPGAPACSSGTVCEPISGNCIPIPPISSCSSSLMGYWHFNDGTSGQTPTTTTDSSGYSNNGTITGPSGSWSWLYGITNLSNIIYFNNDANITFNSINLPPEGTLEMLIIPTPSGSELKTLVDSVLSSSECLRVARDPVTGKLTTLTTNGLFGNMFTSASTSNNVMYHVAIGWTASPSTSAIIINGNPNYGISSAFSANCDSPLYIGGPTSIIPGTLTGFQGAIDEVILFNSLLPLSTIQEHAYRGLSQQEYCSPSPLPSTCSSTYPACNGTCPVGQTCLTIGSSCGCGIASTCGDGIVQFPNSQGFYELCDGTEFHPTVPTSCADYGYGPGTVDCSTPTLPGPPVPGCIPLLYCSGFVGPPTWQPGAFGGGGGGCRVLFTQSGSTSFSDFNCGGPCPPPKECKAVGFANCQCVDPNEPAPGGTIT